VTDQGHPSGSGDQDSTGWVILGAALIVAGLLLGARTLGIVPWPLMEFWGLAVKARYGIGVVAVGVLLIIWAQSGRSFAAPAKGAKLYRAREGKWVAGVLGGLAEYFQVDVTWLRLAFIALVVLLDMGALVVAYIIMAIVVPLEPEASQGGGAAASAPPVAPAPAAAPAPASAEPSPPAADNAAPPAGGVLAPPSSGVSASDGADPPPGVTQA